MSLPIDERNRANAQHSTGPKTEEGKAASSQNARKHGLSSAQLFLPEERVPEFESLFTSLFQEIRPAGELQAQFFEQAVHASWNLITARRLLAVAMEHMDEKKIANANRYVNQYERSFARALKEIKALQTDLALRAMEENEPIADLPLTCEIKIVANEATKLAEHPAEPGGPPKQTHRRAILTRVGAAFRVPNLRRANQNPTRRPPNERESPPNPNHCRARTPGVCSLEPPLRHAQNLPRHPILQERHQTPTALPRQR